MSFLGKLFGKKTDPVPPPLPKTAGPVTPPSDPSKDPNMIRVHDAYGREMFITKQAWRDSVLLDHIKKVWDDPEALYPTIVQSLQDGFGADMLKPAEQLASIDPNAERGAIVLAIVYREHKRPAEAENVLRRHIARHGESGVVLTNLAKVQADRGQHELSLETLWRGIQLDPNQDNGMGWYEVIHRDKQGPAAGLEALRRIAAIPGAWRARLWLARDALERRDLPGALAFYAEAFALVPSPAPTDMLQQISGDLGNHGHLPEILQLISPRFDIAQHGLAVGNNLIKANLDLGRLDAARALLDLHYAQKRPDWKDTLSFWDTELAKLHVASTPVESAEKISVALLVGEGPVWLPEESPAAELFPVHAGEPLRIAFLGSTAETPASVLGEKPAHQMADAPGRLSRATPLFLAEQIRFRTHAAVRTLLPWVQGSAPAFVLSGVPWENDAAAQHARSGETPCDYVVITHLKAVAESWSLDLRLVRTIDATCLATASVTFPHEQLQAGLAPLADKLLQHLVHHAEITQTTPPPFYRVPAGADFPQYLLRLEQLLAVRCAGIPGTPAAFLSGEREMLDGNLHLCLNHPDNVTTRLVFLQTLHRMKKVRPEVVAEFRDRVLLLQKEKPLPEPAQAVAQRLVSEVLAV
jgi:tetratricopeptide (TPR) repeat protein